MSRRDGRLVIWSATSTSTLHLQTRETAHQVFRVLAGLSGYAAARGSMGAPMGGVKAFGIGRRHGEHGIVKYTGSQTISVERLLSVGVPDGVNPARYARLATAGLRLLKRMPGVR